MMIGNNVMVMGVRTNLKPDRIGLLSDTAVRALGILESGGNDAEI
jgi:hypothetical protein